MTTGVMVVGDIGSKNSTERFRAQDDHVIQAFSTQGTYQAFDVRRLPGRLRSRQHLLYRHAQRLFPEGFTVDLVTVAQEVAGSRIPRECLHELGCGPFGSRMLGHIEMQDTS